MVYTEKMCLIPNAWKMPISNKLSPFYLNALQPCRNSLSEVCVYICVCVCVYIYICVCVYITHTHTHTQFWLLATFSTPIACRSDYLLPNIFTFSNGVNQKKWIFPNMFCGKVNYIWQLLLTLMSTACENWASVGKAYILMFGVFSMLPLFQMTPLRAVAIHSSLQLFHVLKDIF
jgi:hypothetical protein